MTLFLKRKTKALLLLLFLCCDTKAGESWQCDLYSYRSDEGLGPTTYLDEWRINGGTTYDECLQIGNEALKDHKAGTIDGAKILGAFSCEPIK